MNFSVPRRPVTSTSFSPCFATPKASISRTTSRPTLQRRIKRRMVLTQSERLEDYLRFVKDNPKELDELYKDVLIHVTGFFRDPGAFDALRKEVFPLLVQDRKLPTGPFVFGFPAAPPVKKPIPWPSRSWSTSGRKMPMSPRPRVPAQFRYSPLTSVMPLSIARAPVSIRTPSLRISRPSA